LSCGHSGRNIKLIALIISQVGFSNNSDLSMSKGKFGRISVHACGVTFPKEKKLFLYRVAVFFNVLILKWHNCFC